MQDAEGVVLLTDEQIQRFIADGFIKLDTALPAVLHEEITSDLRFAMQYEAPHLGDNVLPRIPKLNRILDSPVVHGALQSILGEGYAWAPHRFPHNSEPLTSSEEFKPFDNQPKMGRGSISGSGFHQDGHSRAGRSRWHSPRAINLFYFPHDTPLIMGPTRLLAGTHLNATLREVGENQLVWEPMKAGTVIIAHFDIGHAGTPNYSESSRYMVKFVSLRTREPVGPSWSNVDSDWHTPENLITPHRMPQVWTSIWNWMRGVKRDSGIDVKPVSEISNLLVRMQSADQCDRLTGLYDLIGIGEPSVAPLVEVLLVTSGLDRHVSPTVNTQPYFGMSENHLDRHFSNRQFVPEDAAVALGAIGEPALASLQTLLSHEDPWIRINAVYALGEVGPRVVGADVDEIARLLDDENSAVVRATADALCLLNNFGPKTVARLHRILVSDRAGWEEAAMGDPQNGWYWSVQNQIRYQCSWALLARASADDFPDGLEEALVAALDDETGYVAAVACEALDRLGTVSGLRAALNYLAGHRWDEVHHKATRKGLIARRNREAKRA